MAIIAVIFISKSSLFTYLLAKNAFYVQIVVVFELRQIS